MQIAEFMQEVRKVSLERSGPKQPREAKISATMDYGQGAKKPAISSEMLLSGAVSQVVEINKDDGSEARMANVVVDKVAEREADNAAAAAAASVG